MLGPVPQAGQAGHPPGEPPHRSPPRLTFDLDRATKLSRNFNCWILVTVLAILLTGMSWDRNEAEYKKYLKKADEFDTSLAKMDYPDGNIRKIFGSEGEDHLFISAQNLGILRSDDAGEHWASKMRGIAEKNFKKVAVYDFAEDIQRRLLYTATDDGIYKSSDYGENWVRYSESLPFETHCSIIYDLDLDQATGDLFARVAMDGFGIWKRGITDKKWLPIGDGLPEESIVTDLCFSPQEKALYVSNGFGPVLILSDNFEYNMGVYKGIKQGDGHYLWQNTNLPVDKKHSPVQTLAIDPGTGYVYASGKKGTFRKTSQGWEQVINQSYTLFTVFEKELHHRALIVSFKDIYLRATDREIDQDTWIKINKGWADYTTITSALFYKNNIYIGTNDGLNVSSDNGNSWHLVALTY